MIKKAKISAPQLCILLVVSRLFSIFSYNPKSYDLSAISMAICIVISAVINLLILLPAILLIRKRGSVSIPDTAFIECGKTAYIYSAVLLLACLFLSVECLTQFEFFMSSTLYLTSSPLVFLLPMLIAAVFICHKGVETIARLSGFVFVGLVLSLLLISILATPNFDAVWIGNVQADNMVEMLRCIFDHSLHTTEIVVFLVLCENVKKGAEKAAVWFVIISALLLELVTIVTVLALGDYRKTLLFPLYTVSAMSENSLTDRFGLVFIVLWVFMAAIKLSIYLFVAAKSLSQFISTKKSGTLLLICAFLVLAASLYTTDKIISVEMMYRIIMSGVPILMVSVSFPISILIKKNKRGD